MTEFYTKLFVKIDISLQALLQVVASICNGDIDVMTVEAGRYEVDVLENKDASVISDPSDFMSFDYIVEIVNIEDTTLDAYLEFTGNLMTKLNSNDAKVVAACDWEEKLPGSGKLG
ncbi:MAG: hypothetical protein ACRBCI_13480 [Cellvibrionaceae bacterium]